MLPNNEQMHNDTHNNVIVTCGENCHSVNFDLVVLISLIPQIVPL